MKKILVAILCISCLGSCFLSRQKYGCPSDGRNIGAEKVLAGDKVKKAKWRGG
ncbi:MAG: hypothetical protein IPJ81_02005 [Chitinophagaceae bacterium]|nr:hypothetical protein [Chitinophagaceae bacterium]